MMKAKRRMEGIARMEEEKTKQVRKKLGWRGINNNLERRVREPQERRGEAYSQ